MWKPTVSSRFDPQAWWAPGPRHSQPQPPGLQQLLLLLQQLVALEVAGLTQALHDLQHGGTAEHRASGTGEKAPAAPQGSASMLREAPGGPLLLGEQPRWCSVRTDLEQNTQLGPGHAARQTARAQRCAVVRRPVHPQENIRKRRVHPGSPAMGQSSGWGGASPTCVLKRPVSLPLEGKGQPGPEAHMPAPRQDR